MAEDNKNKENKPSKHEEPLNAGDAIDTLLHMVLDIEECAQEFIDIAIKNYNDNAHLLTQELETISELLKDDLEPHEKISAFKQTRRFIRARDRHNNSQPVYTLEKSLFISLFAAFDKFVGDLINVLYRDKPELLNNLDKAIPLSDILRSNSIDEIKEHALMGEIDKIRRKSYLEQFEYLEKRFSVALTKFEEWPDFIECAQRRNLLTHCDGVISHQYISECRRVGYSFENEPKVGSQLNFNRDYLFRSAKLVAEVAIMLGQTLWRKTNPDNLEACDSHLNSTIYDYLYLEKWDKAEAVSKYALALPKHSNESMQRMITINCSIALQALGEEEKAAKLLDSLDWTATALEFELAYCILTKDFKKAGTIMRRIGKDDSSVPEAAYHDWPLFRGFRDDIAFLDSYEAIFGYQYSSKLISITDESAAAESN